MIIRINAGNTGWGKYVLHGTTNKPRDKSKIKILRGDVDLGDRIVSSGSWKENAYHIILGFKGKPALKKMEAALDDFEEKFMHGFSNDEYHLDAVLHKDTDDYHIHVRIPKMNLKTATQLKLYLDSIDRKRKELIADFIDLKYGLESPKNNKQLIKEEQGDVINSWRIEHGQKPFEFTNKKDRMNAVKVINGLIHELHQAELINSPEDMQTALEEQGLTVERFGYDRAKDFHYVTVSNESGKVRVLGEIYNAEFWKDSRSDREGQIRDNRQHRGSLSGCKEEFKRVQEELKAELAKRYSVVTERYKTSRARADEELENIKREGRRGGTKVSGRHEDQQVSLNWTDNNTRDNKFNPNIQRISEVGKFKNVADTEKVQEREYRWEEVHSHTQEYDQEHTKLLFRADTTRGEIDERTRTSIIERFRKKRESSQQALSRVREERKSVYAKLERNHLNPEQLRIRREQFKSAYRTRLYTESTRLLRQQFSAVAIRLARYAKGARKLRERFNELYSKVYSFMEELNGKDRHVEEDNQLKEDERFERKVHRNR